MAFLVWPIQTMVKQMADKAKTATETAKTVDEPVQADGEAIDIAKDFFAKALDEEATAAETEEKTEVKPTAENSEKTSETTETETDESLEDLAKLSDEQLEALSSERKWDETYLKRVKKFTRQLRESQERFESETTELRTQLERTKPADTPRVSADGPMARIDSPQALEAEKGKAEDALEMVERLQRRARRDPESVAKQLKAQGVPLEEETTEAVEEALDSISANINRTLRRAIPERAKFLETVSANVGAMLTEFPELKDPKNKLTLYANEELQKTPQLKLAADWPQRGVELALGRIQREERRAKGKEKAPVKAPPKIPGTPKTAPGTANPNGKADAAKARALKSGSEEDVARYLQEHL